MVSFIRKIKSDIDSANPFSFPQTIKFCNTLLQSTGNRWKLAFFQARNILPDYKSVIKSFVSFCYQILGDCCICLLMCVILRSLATHLAPSLLLIIDLCMVNYHYHCSQTIICVFL